MQQGLGKCYLELYLSKDILKYKDTVLWGCLHNLSFDTQCEGTRAAYVYQLASFFDDIDYFLLPTLEAFRNIPRRADWLFSHFCELLMLFAADGSKQAHDALLEKYALLLSALKVKKRYNEYDFERDSFEKVCISLTSLGGADAFLKIAEDMGRLFIENPHYGSGDFDCFLVNSDNKIGGKKINSLLMRYAKKSSDIRFFYDYHIKTRNELRENAPKPIVPISLEELKYGVKATGRLSSAARIRFMRTADDGQKTALALAVFDEPELSQKAELLSAFEFRDGGFPLKHEKIIEYSRSSNERLQEVAFHILTSCRSDIVRQYAEELVRERNHISCALQMLICNYIPENKSLLLTELYKLPIDYQDEFDWHTIGFTILATYDKGLRLPKEFLLYIYNTTLCSCCREYAIRELAKHKWLTGDIIKECRYDSNCDIVSYINRYYRSN